MMDMGEKLKQQRKKSGLTQTELANELFVSSKTISNWETGKNQPDTENLMMLAAFYHLSIEELLGENNSKSENRLSMIDSLPIREILCFLLGLWTTLFLVDQWLNMDLLLPLILCSVSAFGFYYQIKERERIGK